MSAVEKGILTINGGSSSIKFALFTASRLLPLTLRGQIARIGMPDSVFSVQGADQIEHFARPVAAKDHTAGVALLMDWIKERDIASSLVAVGHRIVHRGPNFHEPQRLTLELVEALRGLTALDPEHLPEERALAAKPFNEMVNAKSGMLGASETSADMRDLLKCENQDPRAAEAVALFGDQIRKWIGAFAAALGGLDMLVFAGGIGKKSPVVRQRICAALGFLGIELEGLRNEANAEQISTAAAWVKVRVMRTNEERVSARSVCRILGIVTEKQESK